MELKNKAASGIVWSALQRVGNQAISFLVFLILSRMLGPEEFGLVALATIFTSFIQLFVDQGFSIAIVQFPKLEREHLDTAFWTAVLFGISLAGLGILTSKLVASFFHDSRLTPILIWLSLDMILVSLSSTQQACLLRNLNFKGLTLRTLIGTLSGGMVGIAAAIAGLGVFSLVIKTIVMHLVGAVILWNVSDWRPGFRFSSRHFKSLFRFGYNITANNLLNILSRRADNFLIGRYLGTTTLGYYAVAFNFIATLNDIFITTSTSVTLSAFSRLQDDRERMRLGFYTATRYSSLVAFPFFIAVAILSRSLITVLFGEKWIPSTPVIQVLALMGLIYPISIFNTQILVAIGKPSWRFGIMLIYAIADVIGFLIAIRWGMVAVAAALVLRLYLLAPISYFAVHRVIRIDFGAYFRQFIPPLVGTATMAAILLSLSPILENLAAPFLRILISAFSGGIVYLFVVHAMAPHISQEVFELIRPGLPWPRRS